MMKSKTKDRLLTIRITSEEHEALKRFCESRGETMSERIRQYIVNVKSRSNREEMQREGQP